MSETKHTPGPWEVAGDYPTLIIIESKKAVLCSVNWYLLMKDAPTRSECKANGKLIAAAPELLAALRIVERHIKNNEGNCDWTSVDPGDEETILLAIKKAEGRE